MNIDPSFITLTVALLALMMPWLYDGSLFIPKPPQRVRLRGFDRTERRRQRYTESQIQGVRDKARRGL